MFGKKLEVQVAEVEARCKSNGRRLDDVERKLEDNERMLSSIAVIAKRQDDMDGDIKEIKSDVKSLTSKPAKRWDSVVEKVMLTAAGAVVAYILAHIGLG